MTDKAIRTPVLFLIFNRPDTTRKVFAEIRKAKPSSLYLAADGPRENKHGEAEKVKEVREYVMNNIDWNCEVKTLFREKNLGCRIAVSSAITWFFENEEMGIILEDDCLPHSTFFRFCEELLEKYRDDERIGMISGNNFQFGRKRTEYSYYFSRHVHIWGWASWRRAWKYYDVDMKLWPEIRDGNWLQDLLKRKKSVQYWRNIFKKVHLGKIDTWDCQWVFACWVQNELSIIPGVNLVANIGFGINATRTTIKYKFSDMAMEEMKFPLLAPPYIIRDTIADMLTERQLYPLPLGERVIGKIRQLMGMSHLLSKFWME